MCIMRVLGLDGSTTKSGFGLVVDGIPEACGLWKPPSKLKLQEEKIDFMADQARAMIAFTRPDLVVIEECGPQRNAKVFRALVRVEAVMGREARQAGCDVLLVMVKAVREVAMGDGKMGKETVYEKLCALYPQFDWKEVDKGGDDMSDALAMGIAGPRLRDRR
jgi:Holliday junction resolvasome RuvABC endonuclease subunit